MTHYKYSRKIYGFECDIYGHMNNAAYLNLYEEARSEVLDSCGCSVAHLKNQNIDLYLTRIELDFKKEVHLGEKVSIETQLQSISRVRYCWLQTLRGEDNRVCNQALVTGAFVRQGRPFRVQQSIVEAMSQ